MVAGLVDKLERLDVAGHPPVVICSNPQVRPGLKHITAMRLPETRRAEPVEITPDTQVESMGQLGTEILDEVFVETR